MRGVTVELWANKESARVQAVWPIDRLEERDIFLEQMKEFGAVAHETPTFAIIRISVMDKGRRHTEHWDEIRQKIVHMGETVFEIVSEPVA